MRSTLALQCLFAFAAAQEYDPYAYGDYEYEPETPEPETPEPSMIDKLFELNAETGRYELATPDVSDIPEISFAQFNQTAVEQWGDDVEAEYVANDEEWMSAMQGFGAAIAQPWNDFISSAQEIGQARDQLDFSNMEDVFRFITDNVSMDDKSLSETFESEIDEILQKMHEDGTQMSEEYASKLDKIRTPFTMKSSSGAYCVTPYEYNYDYSIPYCDEWSNETKVSKAFESFAEMIKERAEDAGYDSDDVEDWTEETVSQWEELQQRQSAEAAALAMDQTRHASDYAKSVVDGMIENLRGDLEEMSQEVEGQYARYLDDIELMKNQMLDNLQQWADSSYDDVVDLTEESDNYFNNATDSTNSSISGQEYTAADYEMSLTDSTNSSISGQEYTAADYAMSFAQAQVESESTNNYGSAYGFGAVALGVAAAAYFYNKKEQTKIDDTNESEFLLV